MVNDIKTLQMYVLELSAKVKALKEEIDILSSGGFMPAGSVYFADLPSLIDERYGFVYNIKDDFITTSDFIEGAGKRYSAGTNVGIVKDDNNNLKYDTLASFVDTAAIYEAIGAKQNINLSEEIAGASTVEGALKAINQSAGITVDAEISSISTNPVQNKVIKGQLDLKLDADGKANSATSADYATKAERDSHNNVISSTYATKTELSDGLSGKVNAVAGKGLSSNDYTNEDKDYVDGLPAQLLGKQDKYETITYAQWQAMTPAQKAAKDYYISNYPASVLTAGNIAYDNTSSRISANKVQGAIDELKNGLNNQTTPQLVTTVTLASGLSGEVTCVKIGQMVLVSGYCAGTMAQNDEIVQNLPAYRGGFDIQDCRYPAILDGNIVSPVMFTASTAISVVAACSSVNFFLVYVTN